MAEVLKQLQIHLKAAGYKTELTPPGKGSPLPHLYIDLKDNRLDIVPASAAQASVGLPVEETVDYLQFFVQLPFIVEPAHAAATARLIAHLNAQIPLPGFCLPFDGGQVFFRYLMLIEAGKIAALLAIEAVGTITFLLETFTEALRTVATGQRSVEQAISSLQLT
jgi:hypothetical protein